MKTKQNWLSAASGAGLVLLIFLLGWSSSFSTQQALDPADRISLKVNSLVAVDQSLNGHYMLIGNAATPKDTIHFTAVNPLQLPKKIRLAAKKKYLIVDDDIVFLSNGVVEDKVDRGNLGIVDDDIVFLSMSGIKDTVQAPLPQGTGLRWDAISLQDSSFQVTVEALPDEQPAHVFARDLSFTVLDHEYLTIMGFKYDEQGQAHKGIWKFKLSALKGLYKAKASEHIHGQWKELWLYKN